MEHVAVSALSYHLGNLEAELGVALFRRKPRGLEPTADIAIPVRERENSHITPQHMRKKSSRPK